MENLINWVEIPAADFNRAVTFYRAILSIDITEADMHGTMMGFFPSDGLAVSGAIVQGPGYQPSATGTVVYLNGGADLQPILDRIVANGGTIRIPKTLISPEMGC